MKVNRVNKARKSPGRCCKCGVPIKEGEPYRWVKAHMRAPRKLFCQNHNPRQSDLTTSDKLSTLYALQETVEDLLHTEPGRDELVEALRDAAASANDVAQEYRDAKDNMPENLQNGSVAEEMEQKADEIESWAQELEAAADEIEAMDDWAADAEEAAEDDTEAKEDDGGGEEKPEDTSKQDAQDDAYSQAGDVVGSLSV